MSIYLIVVILILLLFISWRYIFFFRNPARTSSSEGNVILSPADGYVLYIRHILDSDNEVFSIKKERKILLHELMLLRRTDFQFKSGWLIGIVMSPFDVHFNRSPISGFIKKIGYEFPTSVRKNFTMFPALQNLFFKVDQPYSDCYYIVYNERASYVITNEKLQVFVTQIADKYVRKIITYKNDVNISRGEVFGMIRMGSQVDIFIPDEKDTIKIVTKEREHLKAGRDVVAYY